MFLDNRKEKAIQTYTSALSRYLEPSNIVYIRLMSSGFSEVDYKGNLWHDIQFLGLIGREHKHTDGANVAIFEKLNVHLLVAKPMFETAKYEEPLEGPLIHHDQHTDDEHSSQLSASDGHRTPTEGGDSPGQKIEATGGEVCDENHTLEWAINKYWSSFRCDKCGISAESTTARWLCKECRYDVCNRCMSAPSPSALSSHAAPVLIRSVPEPVITTTAPPPPPNPGGPKLDVPAPAAAGVGGPPPPPPPPPKLAIKKNPDPSTFSSRLFLTPTVTPAARPSAPPRAPVYARVHYSSNHVSNQPYSPPHDSSADPHSPPHHSIGGSYSHSGPSHSSSSYSSYPASGSRPSSSFSSSHSSSSHSSASRAPSSAVSRGPDRVVMRDAQGRTTGTSVTAGNRTVTRDSRGMTSGNRTVSRDAQGRTTADLSPRHSSYIGKQDCHSRLEWPYYRYKKDLSFLKFQGTSVTSGSKTVFRDSSGRTTGTATVSGGKTVFRDASGRTAGSATGNAKSSGFGSTSSSKSSSSKSSTSSKSSSGSS